MKKSIILIVLFFAASGLFAQKTFFDFEAVTIHGDTISMSQFEGKKIMVVNTASKCGYTYQYENLQALYAEHGGEDFEIIGFPANNFSNQEPGDDDDIWKFCQENYGVTFTMMSKISVAGFDKHPVYKWLTNKNENGVMSSTVKWNFQKYLINPDGSLHDVAYTQEEPNSSRIVDWITDPSSIEITPELEVKIYPNPAETHISIDHAGFADMLTITCLNGNTMLSEQNVRLEEKTISIENYPAGTYFIEAVIDGKRVSEKFVVE